MTTLLYIDKYTDETIPCAPTFDGWAQWLNAPDLDDPWRSEPARNGERFAGRTCERVDVVATWDEESDSWIFDPPNVHCDWCAETFGPGMGWSSEMVGGTPRDILDGCERDEPINMAFLKDNGAETFEFQRDDLGRPSLRSVRETQCPPQTGAD